MTGAAGGVAGGGGQVAAGLGQAGRGHPDHLLHRHNHRVQIAAVGDTVKHQYYGFKHIFFQILYDIYDVFLCVSLNITDFLSQVCGG